MDVHNFMEDVVKNLLEVLMAERSDICNCEKCRLDIMAVALNKLQPKYVVTEKGRVYLKLTELELQFRADVARELTKSIEFVKTHQKH